MASTTKFMSVDLSTTKMPLLSTLKSMSETYTDKTNNLSEAQPSLIYAHNVMPTGQGLVATKPLTFCSSLVDEVTLANVSYRDSENVFVVNVIDRDLNKAILILEAYRDSNNFLQLSTVAYSTFSSLLNTQHQVTPLTGIAGLTSDSKDARFKITSAEVKGRTHICISITFTDIATDEVKRETKFYRIESALAPIAVVEETGDLPTLQWSGLADEVVKGITTTSNYLIAYSDSTVAWSSPSDMYNFTPSTITGAGSGSPEGAFGTISTIVPTTRGFNIWYTLGIIAARLSNNTSYAWNFTRINTAVGVNFDNNVTTSYPQYAITSGGLTSVDNTKTEVLAPELSDFIAGGTYEYWDDATSTLVREFVVDTFDTRIAYSSDRYIAVSYKKPFTTVYKYIIIYDLLLQAYGKIKVDHVAVFPLQIDILGDWVTYEEMGNVSYAQLGELDYTFMRAPTNALAPSVKYVIGVVHADGQLQLLDPSISNDKAGAVALLGTFSTKQGIATTIDHVVLEEVVDVEKFSLFVDTSYKGKTIDKSISPYLAVSDGGMLKYNVRSTGVNHTVRLEGSFNLTKLSVAIRAAGYR